MKTRIEHYPAERLVVTSGYATNSSQQFKCFVVRLPPVEMEQRLAQSRLFRRDMRKKRHGRPEFEVVSRPKNLMGGPALSSQDKLRAFFQPLAEDRVLPICNGFFAGLNAKVLCDSTPTQSLELRKNEPHPVAILVTGSELF